MKLFEATSILTLTGSSNSSGGYDIALDSNGNPHVTGHTAGTVKYGGTTVSTSGAQHMVAKLSTSGTWIWAVASAGGLPNSYSYGNGIALDSKNTPHVTGYTQGTGKYGSTTISAGSNNQLLVAKLTTSGTWAWAVATTSSGSASSYGYGIALDSNGNPHVTGLSRGTVKYGATTISTSSPQLLVAKLSSSGTWTWAVASTSTGTSYTYGHGIALDTQGNIHVAGQVGGPVNFGSTKISTTGSKEAMVSKLNPGGTWIWTTASQSASSSYAYAYGIALDGTGMSHICGSMMGVSSFGGTSITADGFVWQVDKNGK